jgi:hypothetical protein
MQPLNFAVRFYAILKVLPSPVFDNIKQGHLTEF